MTTTIERAMAAKAAKPQVHIKDVLRIGKRITGVLVSGHPSLPNGAEIITSEIVELCPADTVETKNTHYIVDNWL